MPTFLTLLVLGVPHHPEAHCFAWTQGTFYLAIVTAKIYYSDAGKTYQQQGEGLLRQSLEEARPGFPALRLPAGRCQQH